MIVFVNRFYWPDVAATGQILTDLAEDLAASGRQVTVVTARAPYAASSSRPPITETRAGVHIVRVPTTRFGQDNLLGRSADYASFLVGAFFALLRLRRPRVMVAMTDPPFLTAAVVAAARLKGARTVHWAQDVYPQMAARLGVLRERGVVYRVLARLASLLYRRCDAVVAQGPRMREALMAAGAEEKRITAIANWADVRAVRPVPRAENTFIRENGLENKFVVLYSGNAGRAHTFDAVIEAARRLREDAGILFLFIGDGARLPELRATVERESLPNIRFLGYVSREQLAQSLSAAHVSLVTERPEAAGLLFPSKTTGIMASGRPCVFIGSDRSDVAGLIRAGGCGVVIAPDDPDTLVDTIRTLRDDPSAAAEMGARGRAVAEVDFARHTATPRWGALLASLLLLVVMMVTPLNAQVTDEYVVRAGDVLKIRVWPEESLSGEFPVELSGYVYLPIIGEFPAAGLPLSRLQQELRGSYAELMKEPVVSITPVFPVGVLGGVASPGMYRAEPTFNLMDVIISAGGFTARARRDDVRVIRDGNVIRYDAERALETGESELLVLQSGDRIVIPERRRVTLQAVAYVLQLAGTVVILYNQLK